MSPCCLNLALSVARGTPDRGEGRAGQPGEQCRCFHFVKQQQNYPDVYTTTCCCNVWVYTDYNRKEMGTWAVTVKDYLKRTGCAAFIFAEGPEELWEIGGRTDSVSRYV